MNSQKQMLLAGLVIFAVADQDEVAERSDIVVAEVKSVVVGRSMEPDDAVDNRAERAGDLECCRCGC